MGGFAGALANVGKGILERSVAHRLMNRYRRDPNNPTAPPAPVEPPVPGYPQPADPGPADESGSTPMDYENAGQGKLVTHPIIARVGEKGPEAIIPLNNAPGNHVRPDMLQGHLAPPKVPGMRYQKFKGYVNPTY